MDFEFGFLKTLIHPDAFIIVPVLYLLRLFLSQTPKIPKWSYAWILLVIGVFFCFLRFGFGFQSYMQGVLCTGAAMLLTDLLHLTKDAALRKNKSQDKDI